MQKTPHLCLIWTSIHCIQFVSWHLDKLLQTLQRWPVLDAVSLKVAIYSKIGIVFMFNGGNSSSYVPLSSIPIFTEICTPQIYDPNRSYQIPHLKNTNVFVLGQFAPPVPGLYSFTVYGRTAGPGANGQYKIMRSDGKRLCVTWMTEGTKAQGIGSNLRQDGIQ